MPRLVSIEHATATGRAKAALDSVKSKLGVVPAMTRQMAASPAVLEGYLGFAGALASGRLDAALRERIALAVGEANACTYCVTAHSAFARRAGLAPEAVLAARRGEAEEPRVAVALHFARRLVAQDGHATDDDLAALRAAGWDDGEIGEIVANVVINVFTNWFNHVAETEVDFPAVPRLAA